MPSVGRKPANPKPKRQRADAGGNPAALRKVRGGVPEPRGDDPVNRPVLLRYHAALQYELRLQEAREDFLTFCEMMMPGADPNDPYDTGFHAAEHHRFMAELVHRVINGQVLDAITNMPPRHGKTWMLTKMLAAWFIGRNPDLDVMVATYNNKYAEGDLSGDFLQIVTSQRFRQVFPTFALNPKQNASDHRQTTQGGNVYFVGIRSTMTGRGGHLILIDDPMKDAREAASEVSKDALWDWFRRTIYTRKHHSNVPLLVTQTRWTADDLVGRIADPANLHYSPEFGGSFNVINLPALATQDHDLVGRMQGEALWPEKFDAPSLKRLQAADPVGFSCLYQGNPVPDEGVIFQPDDLPEYSREELRQIEDRLVIYVFSDHAYGTTKHHDPSCFAPVGIAPNGDAYFLPDLFWDRVSPDDAVERAIEMIQRRRPMEWIAENHHIFKGIEPFLKKRMTETGAIVPITAVWPKGKTGKADRAVGAHARCRMGKIKFPGFASWWPRARAELLAFPNGNNDDFVDVLSLLGLQLDRICQRGARVQRKEVEVGTYDWWFRDEERRGINTFGRTGRAV